MLIGFPVAFSLAALGLCAASSPSRWAGSRPSFMASLPLNVFGILSNELLLAIPFFTLMGAILEKCGLAEDMLDSMGQLFGPVRGGLGYSVIIVGFILGAITGTVAGQVIAMAMISLPVMMRYGYNMRYATGVLAASGTITQLVPPSLVLVVHGRPARPLGGRHVQGRLGPVDPAGAALRCSTPSCSAAHAARRTCRACRRRRARCTAGRCGASACAASSPRPC